MPRRLGQHFLIRTSILQQIAAAAVPDPGMTVIEIGPGRGALTHFLQPKAAHLVAIEVDHVLVHYLEEKFRQQTDVEVISGDVLQADLSQWGPVSVVGNLPYYITSPIIGKVLALGSLLRNAVFLVQKEVADRITAMPGTRDYGYLSVVCQISTEARYLTTVPPEAFKPPPKVDSAVVQLIPRMASLVADPVEFLRFASLCFLHKRKTLRNNLRSAFPAEAVEAQPEARLRAEQLPVVQMADLYRRLKEQASILKNQ